MAVKNSIFLKMKMPRYLFLLFTFWISKGCQNNRGKADINSVAHQDTIVVGNETVSYFPTMNFNIWKASYIDNTGKLKFEQTRQIIADSLAIPILIGRMNNTWPFIKVEYSKISNDTLFLLIPESEVLTERIGTSGAFQYLAELTYNMTENKKVKFVDLDFQAGEHTTPMTWSRKDFEKR